MPTWVYKGTAFAETISILRLNGSAKCPKCTATIYSYKRFLSHIEQYHSEDLKHKPRLKSYNSIQEEPMPVDNEQLQEPVNTFEHEFNEFDNCDLNDYKENPFFKVFVLVICLQFLIFVIEFLL